MTTRPLCVETQIRTVARFLADRGIYLHDVAIRELLQALTPAADGQEATTLLEDIADLREIYARDKAAHPTPQAEGREPDGYAYRYTNLLGDGTHLQFNNGREWNGHKPIEAIPYYLGTTPAPSDVIEQCAKVCDAMYNKDPQSDYGEGWNDALDIAEQKIRAIRQQHGEHS